MEKPGESLTHPAERAINIHNCFTFVFVQHNFPLMYYISNNLIKSGGDKIFKLYSAPQIKRFILPLADALFEG